jgi:hypothetical protein
MKRPTCRPLVASMLMMRPFLFARSVYPGHTLLCTLFAYPSKIPDPVPARLQTIVKLTEGGFSEARDIRQPPR